MRLLQVGLGNWGRNWASAIVPAVPDADPVGYVDLDRDALAALVDSGTATAGQCFSSLEEGLAKTNPDAVLVTTNLPGHVPAARAALEAGRHVLVEKPFAPSVDEALALVDLADKEGLTLMVSQNYRFFPAVRGVQALVRGGTLGTLLGIDVDFRREVGARRRRPRRPGRPGLAEPLLGDMAIHHFDLMRAVTGLEVAEVYCRTWHPDGYGFAGPPAGAALITLAGGVVVSYRGSWISGGPSTCWAGEWRMEFEKGQLRWTSRGDGSDPLAQDAIRLRSPGGEEQTVDLPDVSRVDRRGSLTEFMAAVREGRSPETAGRDNVASLAISYAAIESARRGSPVVPATGRQG